jgi:hypothetical protein
MRLTTPRGRRAVVVRISYWPRRAGQPSRRLRVGLRRSTAAAPAVPPAAPQVGAGGGGGGALSDERPALVVFGDSLAIGTAQPLVDDLPDFDVKTDARVGRPLAEGMDVLSDVTLPSQSEGRRTLLAFSLFTNDTPTDVAALVAAVRASVARLGPGGCAMWATISRPAPPGSSYRAANARLKKLATDPHVAGRLLVVRWAEQVVRHRGWVGPDHVHPTVAGASARARMYAGAARRCRA